MTPIPDLFTRILEAGFAASLLAAGVLCAQALAGKQISARWRHLLWLPVVARLFMPAAPESSWSLFNAPKWFAGDAEPRVVIELGAVPEGRGVERLAGGGEDRPGLAVLAGAAQTRAAFDWFAACAWVWAGVAAVLLARLALGGIWMAARLRRETGIPGAEILAAFESSTGRLRPLFRPRVVETERVSSPALFGVFRPMLLLPRGVGRRLGRSELEHVFLHELAHLKRGDLWMNWLMAAAQALHWFNPLVWVAFRRMRLDRELACDEMALRASGEEEAKRYGETILRLLEMAPSRPAIPGLVGIAEEKVSASERLRGIAAYRPKPAGRWIALPLLAGLSLGGLTSAQSPEPAEPPRASPETQNEPKTPGVETGWNAPAAPLLTNPDGNGRVYSNQNRIEIARKLEVVIDSFHIPSAMPLGEVLIMLDREMAAAGAKVNLIISPTPMRIQDFASPISFQSAASSLSPSVYQVLLDPPLRECSAKQILDAIVHRAKPPETAADAPPLFYSLESYGVVIQPSALENAPLYTRTYKVEPQKMERAFRNHFALPRNGTNQASAEPELVKRYFEEKGGIDFSAGTISGREARLAIEAGKTPPQKAIFFNHRTGLLFARATLADLDRIERVLQKLDVSVTTEAKFVLLPREVVEKAGWDWVFEASEDSGTADAPDTKASTAQMVLQSGMEEVLADAASAQSASIDLLSAPKVTALPGQEVVVSIEPGPRLEANTDFDLGTGLFTTRAIASVPPHADGRVDLAGAAQLHPGESLVLARVVPGQPKKRGFFGRLFGRNTAPAEDVLLVFITPSVSIEPD